VVASITARGLERIGNYMKIPPKQMRDSVARELSDSFIRGGDAGGDAGVRASQMTAGE
jgi:hypothetical protein